MTYTTVPQIAERFGVKPEKIVAWIRTGELRAMNVAQRAGGRPRYRINPADLADFENRRAIISTTKPAPRKRRHDGDVIQFF